MQHRPRFTRWMHGAALGAALGVTANLVHAQGVTINFTCGSTEQAEHCQRAAEEWAQQTGNRANLISMPNSSTEQLALYQQLLGSQASDIDVILTDTTWPGILGDHLHDLHQLLPGDITSGQFETVIANNTIDGELKAMPLYTDASLLYYREDLLEKYDRPVPRTWDEMTDTAAYIQQREREEGNRGIWGFVFQGRAYEGLTCNLLEWVVSEGGGLFLDQDGQVDVDNPATRRALERAHGWIDTISPRGTLSYVEEQSRGVFQSGNAVFMRNWPYVWSLTQSEGSPVRGKVGVAPVPSGSSGRHVSTLGGWSLAVSRYSRHPKEAAELVAYLTRRENQKYRAINLSYLPSYVDLFEDPEVLEAAPFIGTMRGPVEQAVARPASLVKTLYPRYSNAIFDRTHRVLTNEASIDEALETLNRDMLRIARRGFE